MEEKPLTKNQHFVPQFYLRNFANKNKELHVFNAKEKRVEKTRGAAGICAELFFYAAKTGEQDTISQEIERFFNNQIEDPLSKEMPTLINKIEGCEQITSDDKYTIATFMNTMWLRNPSMRQQINDMEEHLIRELNKRRYSHPSIDAELERLAREEGINLSPKEREDLKEMIVTDKYKLEFSNASHLRFMLDTEHMRGFANLFWGQHWIIHISKCDRHFITSDNPVSVINPPRKVWFGPTFLERTHIFPLTPTIAIEAVFPFKDSGKKIKRKTHFKGDEKEIDKINLKIASRANEYIYASRTEEIDWIKDYVKDVLAMREEVLRKIASTCQ